jgi:hypothetical protein
LFLTFPYAFLLKEVQILPHTVSFGNCPAYVSLEVSRDGALMIPVASPVFTMGMSAIKLQLNKSELVNTVQINLFKSKDSHMIGLSQIRLLGYPMFENMLSAKPDMMRLLSSPAMIIYDKIIETILIYAKRSLEIPSVCCEPNFAARRVASILCRMVYSWRHWLTFCFK